MRLCYNTGSLNNDQRPGRPNLVSGHPTLSRQQNTRPFPRGLPPRKSAALDIKTLKEKDTTEVVRQLNEGMAQLKFFLRSQEEQHNSDEFIFDLTCTLAVACRASAGENTNKILAALKGTAFLSVKIPSLLDRVQASMTLNDPESRQKFIQCLITVFMKYLTRLPSSYVDLPYNQLKIALDQSNIERKEELQKELDAFKQARDDIIRGGRQKYGKRFTNRAGEKPPNDFRDIPICPTNKEITTQERPFLRKNISKGRYENAEHYLDVQFRLLREDFLEPLREGIHEIVQNVPRQQRKQLMKNYHSVRIFSKEFTWSGIIHQVQIDVTGLDTRRWAHSKRLIYGSFLCLSNDNFKTMLFATVSKREPELLKKGRIDIRFIEEQDVLGIESRNCVYQMVESPAYFEAYRHVLKGFKELDETTLPFKKYLVECSAQVDPPEYLRRDDTEEPVCYDLSKAFHVGDASIANATTVPVLQPGAWPSVKALPLNSSQLEALRTAITTEFSVIQGPPGTGKTYVGAKIVRCLLENRTAWDPQHNSPMLMVCYTNHALDQFLEKVLEFLPSEEIIRVGGRSKSEKLEACNLRKVTYRYRLYEKRDEVNEKMSENDKELKKWKAYLAKADKQLLEFGDLEELLHPAHADQLYNAMFPPNVANECRRPGNTFNLWLCDNKLLGSCNQSTKTKTEVQTERGPDGSILEEIGAKWDDELSYDATLVRATQDVNEHNTNRQLKSSTRDPPTAVEVEKDATETPLEIQEDSSKQQRSKDNYRYLTSPRSLSVQESNSSLENQPSSGDYRASPDVENEFDSKPLDSIEETDSPQTEKELRGERVDEVCEADEETIAIEKEADLIQYRRRIQGDEDLLLPISQQTDDLISQEQDQPGKKEENDQGWTTVIRKKKGNPFFWKTKEGENYREERKGAQVLSIGNEDVQSKTKSSKRKTKKKKRNKNSPIKITGDISSLEEVLKTAEIMSVDEVMSVDNIWSLPQSDRLRLYLFWIEDYRERYRVEIHRAEQEYEQLCEELQEVTSEEEEQVIRRATVFGMTTSGAARYHSMLQRVAPRIVVIEEAAEVMEAHIVTSLSHNTKHTILIGDHKQLRPKATVYELAQKYNLEVSLFERMVMNSMDCKRLSIQHRMRPEIAALTKRIYDHEIIDHDSVCHFEDISGVCQNMFFVDHCQPETLIGGLQSYSNHHEAEYLVALCNYLLLQGCEGSQITVLTMYTGQLLLLQEHMPKKKFEGVRVCAVDNFQGEENDIILLSLVRSNSEGGIGFLGDSNRICVALSRARKGFYCIGNFSLLKNHSKLWKEICDDLETKEAIGETLHLVCKRHNNVTTIRWPGDFRVCKLGGCTMPCGDRLDCGHACDKLCHASDLYHEKGYCSKMCFNACLNNHPCPQVCHYPEDCNKCHEPVLKTLPRCGHQQPVRCSIDPDEVSCKFQCEKLLTCGHNCQQQCGKLCTEECTVSCKKILPCGHEETMPCSKDPTVHSQCNSKCTKVLDCGHPCSRRCKDLCECNTDIEVQLQCEHIKRVMCREKNNPIQCTERCRRKLDCGHDCSGMCHEECRMRKCKIDVVKVLPCGHQKSVPCHQDPLTVFCYAPCSRQLDCGHKCSSVCGCVCQGVQCKELCQKKCDRGHPCQRRCHSGSSCDNCTIEVNMTIPSCGHNITLPCYVDPSTTKCKRPRERVRECGHPCKEICSKKCEARPCKVLVLKTLSCNHVVTLECHKNAEKFSCEVKVDVCLPCGHKTSLECHVAKAGLENVPCKKQVEKELRCNHKMTLPCYKNPEDCRCRKEISIELPCGHKKSVLCSIVTSGLPNISCKVKVTQKLPCGHETILPCHVNPEEHCCEEEIEIKLSCGHSKLIKCFSKQDELHDGICDTNVTRKLPCGHENKMRCSDKPATVFCDAPCERLLSCGHRCPNKCGHDCASFKCAVGVKKDLSCRYHKVSCLCADDVSQVICLNQCKRKLMCGHQCPGKCSEECSQYMCQKIVVRYLNCTGNHSLKMPCSGDPNSVACQDRCARNLDCGHPCPGLCSQPCESIKCRRGIEKTYPCGHKEHLSCFQSKTAFCKAPCRRRERCKHMCKGVCGEPCSNHPCDVAVGKTLSCGHKIMMPCSYPVGDVQCPARCGKNLPCGHQCSGTCSDCQQRGSHEMCQHPCSRPLVCSHRCQEMCSKPCPPCCRKCSRRCPHEKCTRRCFQSCYPCTKPCTWSCPHYQCNNLCGEECDRPRCNAPCPKKLACRHPCIGLCGENCPTVCAICHAKKLSSMLGGGGRAESTEASRYLQLFDCGHIVRVEEMDAWMLRERDNDVQLIQCPRCSTAITFSYRYGNLIKSTLKNIENVKAQIYELGKETVNSARQLHRPSKGMRTVVEKLSTRPFSMAFNNVHPPSYPLLFTLKNHLLIMQQIEKAHHSLKNVIKHQGSSRGQLEMKQYSDTIEDALDKITEYLQKPQLDLRTLDQLHEHTRKFSLFASILETHSEAIKRQRSFSSIAQTRLKLAGNGFNLFLQGNNNALHIDWLERIVNSLRREVGLTALPSEETKDFENFPGFNKGTWKLCEHRQVYFTRSIVRDGEEVNVVSNGCGRCVETEGSD